MFPGPVLRWLLNVRIADRQTELLYQGISRGDYRESMTTEDRVDFEPVAEKMISMRHGLTIECTRQLEHSLHVQGHLV